MAASRSWASICAERFAAIPEEERRHVAEALGWHQLLGPLAGPIAKALGGDEGEE